MVGKVFLGFIIALSLFVVVLPFDVNTASSTSTRAFEEYDMEELPPKDLNGNFTLDEDDRWDIYGEGILEGNITLFDESLLVIKNANVTINGTIWAMDNSEILIESSTLVVIIPSTRPVIVEKQYDGPNGFMLLEDEVSTSIKNSTLHLIRHQIWEDHDVLMIPGEALVNFGDFYMYNTYLDTLGSDVYDWGLVGMIRGVVMHMNSDFAIINCTLVPGIVFYVNPHGVIVNTTFMSISMQKNTPERLVIISNCTITHSVVLDEASRASFENCYLKSVLFVKGEAEAILYNTSIGGLNVSGNGMLIMDNTDYSIEPPWYKYWNHVRGNSSITLVNHSFIQKLYMFENSSLIIINSTTNKTIMKGGAYASLKNGTIQNLSARYNSTIWLQGSAIEKYDLKDDAEICNITTLAVTTKLNLQPLSIPIELTDVKGDTITTTATNEKGNAEFTLIRDVVMFNETSMKPELSSFTTHIIIKADYKKMHEEEGVDIDAEYIQAEIIFEDYNSPIIGETLFKAEPFFKTNEKVLITVHVEDEETDLANVMLKYSVDDGASWENLTLYSTGQNTYQNSIPGQSDGTKVRFYIIAEDECGNMAESTYYAYNVGEDVILINNLILITALTFIIGLSIWVAVKVLWDKKKIKKYLEIEK